MNPDHKHLAETVLQHVCVGRRIGGMTSDFPPILLLDGRGSPAAYAPIDADVVLTIEHHWSVTGEPGEAPPASDPPTTSAPASGPFALALCELREHPIVNVTLGETAPHLTLHFDNGQRLVINGHNDRFESWQLSAGMYMVVAVPGDAVAVWTADDFDPRSRM